MRYMAISQNDSTDIVPKKPKPQGRNTLQQLCGVAVSGTVLKDHRQIVQAD